MHAALIASRTCADITASRASIVALLAAIALVVLGAARDRAVTVNDERAGTRCHAVETKRRTASCFTLLDATGHITGGRCDTDPTVSRNPTDASRAR